MAVVFGIVITRRAMHYLPLVGMVLLAAGHRGVRGRAARQPAAGAGRLGADGPGPGRHRRARAVRRGLLAAVEQPSARVRDHRALPRGGGVHGRADPGPLRGHRRDRPHLGHRATRSGSASVWRSAARCSASPSTRSAVPARRSPTSTSSWTATIPPGTRRRCWRELRSGLPARSVATPAMARLTGVSRRAPFAPTCPAGAVLFAYDGSELAAFAISQAAAQLAPQRDALVVCVWQPVDVGLHAHRRRRTSTPTGPPRYGRPPSGPQRTGRCSPNEAGFRARSKAVEAAPTWKGIVEAARTSTTPA